MSQIQETEIEGSPSSIENVATYLRSTLSGASSTWSGDVDSGRTKATGAWSGAAADARATAYGGGLTVNGTQFHGPGNAPSVQLESAAPYAETPASAPAGTNYSKRVTAWNTSVEQATGGYDAWQQALDAFSKFWNEAGGNFTSLSSGLLTTGVTAGTLANSAYRLQSVKLVDGLRVGSKVSKGLWALGVAGTGYAIYDDMQH